MALFSKTVLIIGGASTALEIRETAEIINDGTFRLLNVVPNGEKCLYSCIYDNELNKSIDESDENYYIIGFLDNTLKMKFETLMDGLGCHPINVIHPSSYIAHSAKIGTGNYLAAYACISSEAVVGNHNIINLGATVGHNVILGNNNALNPGARISGNTIVGDRCLFGSNSFVNEKLHVCSDTKIDALTYLDQNIDTPSICTSNLQFKRYKNRFLFK